MNKYITYLSKTFIHNHQEVINILKNEKVEIIPLNDDCVWWNEDKQIIMVEKYDFRKRIEIKDRTT